MVKKEAPERAAKFGKMSREKGGSMKKERKQYGNEFKAKVVLEVIKGQKTLAEISSHYRVHPSQIMKWKKKVIEALPELFKNGNGKRASTDDDALIAELYQQIGRLKVELDWLKKKSGVIG